MQSDTLSQSYDLSSLTVAPYRRLVCAIVLKAVQDARGAGELAEGARTWLAGPDAAAWAEALGFDSDKFTRQPRPVTKTDLWRAGPNHRRRGRPEMLAAG